MVRDLRLGHSVWLGGHAQILDGRQKKRRTEHIQNMYSRGHLLSTSNWWREAEHSLPNQIDTSVMLPHPLEIKCPSSSLHCFVYHYRTKQNAHTHKPTTATTGKTDWNNFKGIVLVLMWKKKRQANIKSAKGNCYTLECRASWHNTRISSTRNSPSYFHVCWKTAKVPWVVTESPSLEVILGNLF